MTKSIIESSELTLSGDEAAVVLGPERVRLVTPEKKDDDLVGHNVQFAVMLAYLASTDTEWVESVIERFEERTDD